MDMTGKTVLITGASRGIGAEGARVRGARGTRDGDEDDEKRRNENETHFMSNLKKSRGKYYLQAA